MTNSLPEMGHPTPNSNQLADQWNAHPGLQHLGVRIQIPSPGTVRATVDPVLPHHRGGLGTQAVNGPVIAGVFDLVIGLAGYLHTGNRRAGVAQLSVHFLRPVEGDQFSVWGRPVRVGRNLVCCTAELEDQQGILCARCDGIVAIAGRDAGAGVCL